MRTPKTSCWSLLLLLALSGPLSAQTRPDDLQKCRTFVQQFYDWYVPKALKGTGTPASDLAIKMKGSFFSSVLLGALKADSQAQSKAKGEIVGLDFDPFLDTQDPAERYVLGDVKQKDNSYWVEVYSVSSGKKSATPDVIPEVTVQNGRCVFTNFHYKRSGPSEDDNLLTILEKLRATRKRTPE